MAAPNPETFIPVKTTLPVSPLPSAETRGTILTPRLLIRPLCLSDLEAYHKLRSEPETMKWTLQGRPDKDLEETRERLNIFLAPNDVKMSNWAICLRSTDGGENEKQSEMIGIGGCHLFPSSTFGWPELGYMIRQEFWGGGLATEFLGGFLGHWGGLEREERVIFVDERTVEGDVVVGKSREVVRVKVMVKKEGEDGQGEEVEEEKDVEMEIPVVEEQILAVTEEDNGKSQRVLRKNGFEKFVTWTDTDGEGLPVELPTWRYFPVKKRKEEAK